MLKKDLDKVLSDHDLWVRTEGAEGVRANLKDADLTGVNLVGANLRNAYLKDANLINADLYGANLSGANLINADLYGANLVDAYLINADLYGANLSGAKGILSGTFGKHLAVAFCFEGVRYVKIGCRTETVSVWLENFVSVGNNYGYSETETNLYGSFIEFVSKVPDSVFKGGG